MCSVTDVLAFLVGVEANLAAVGFIPSGSKSNDSHGGI